MSSYFLDLYCDAERIRKSLLDQACRIVKSVDRAKASKKRCQENLEKAAQQAERWRRLAESKNIHVEQSHFDRMERVAAQLRQAAQTRSHRELCIAVDKVVQDLRQVVENTKKR